MKLSASIPVLKTQARRLKRSESIPLCEALNRIARQEGYATWSLLVTRATAERSDEIFDSLDAGDLLLLGARPGQGKTARAIKLMTSAMRQGLPCWFFSLENDVPNMDAWLESVGETRHAFSRLLVCDSSDRICAQHVIEQTRDRVGRRSVIVIDYLQLLDQGRETPELEVQVQALRAFAQATGCIVVCISQIQRAFDPHEHPVPNANDVRLVNPLDLSLFDKALFLHQGQTRLVVHAA